MMHYHLTEDQERQMGLAKKALCAVAELTDQTAAAPDPSDLAALLALIAEAIPTDLMFVAHDPLA